jgi:hypothetical protein
LQTGLGNNKIIVDATIKQAHAKSVSKRDKDADFALK